MPDIFVYLKHLNKKISFIRIKAKNIMDKYDQKIEMHFFQISKDKYPEITDDKSGYLKMRVIVGKAENLENFDINKWKKPEGKIEFTEALLYVHIYNVNFCLKKNFSFLKLKYKKAKNLISADDNGLSDPYLLMEFNGVQAKSETLHKTINPVNLSKKQYFKILQN